MTDSDTKIDWSLTTWEGSRRAQLRRWCKLSLRERLRAVQEMDDLARHFADMRARGRFRDLSSTPGTGTSGTPREQPGEPRPATGGVREQNGAYGSGTATPKANKTDKGSNDAEE